MTVSVQELSARIERGLGEVLVGAERTAFALELALFGRGHLLIEGVPGTGKTLLVRALSMLLGMEFKRIQFTPDLMPADVVGTTVFNPKTGEFTTRPGPVFAGVVLADEINRTPPKTQSALLEAMEERRVTIDGTTLDLPAPFLLCATQNPIEYEGTYPLPEAQLDRFFVKVHASYPREEEELALLARAAGGFDAQMLERDGLPAVTNAAEIVAAQDAVRRIHASIALQRYVYEIVAATRSAQSLALGASPRAALNLLTAAQAAAAMQGREFAIPDDVKDVAQLVLAHRVIVHAHAEIEGLTAAEAIESVLASVPVPREAAQAAAP